MGVCVCCEKENAYVAGVTGWLIGSLVRGGGVFGDRWWRWGGCWDFDNTSKTTALPGVCCHFLCRTPPPHPSPNSGTPPWGFHREKLMKNFFETPQVIGWKNGIISRTEKWGEERAIRFGNPDFRVVCWRNSEGLKWQITSRTNLNKYWLQIFFSYDDSTQKSRAFFKEKNSEERRKTLSTNDQMWEGNTSKRKDLHPISEQ